MKDKNNDIFIKLIITIFTLVTIAICAFIFIHIILKSKGVVNLKFLSEKPKGVIFGTKGGVYPAIIGTIYLGLLSIIISGPIAIFTSIYISFYKNKSNFASLVELGQFVGSGIPSILYGLIAYNILILGLEMDKSLLTASLTLAAMLLPFISIRVCKILDESSKIYLEPALSLGFSKEYIIRKIILKDAKFEILSTLALAMSYGIGAIAPIMYTGVVMNAGVPNKINQPFMSLAYHLYMLVTNGISDEYSYGTAFVLLFLLLLIQVSFKFLANFNKRRK